MGVNSHTCLAIFGSCDLEMIWASLDSIFSGGQGDIPTVVWQCLWRDRRKGRVGEGGRVGG